MLHCIANGSLGRETTGDPWEHSKLNKYSGALLRLLDSTLNNTRTTTYLNIQNWVLRYVE